MASALRVERSRQFALEVSNSSKEKGCEMKEDLFFLRWSKELQAEVIKREREREKERERERERVFFSFDS